MAMISKGLSASLGFKGVFEVGFVDFKRTQSLQSLMYHLISDFIVGQECNICIFLCVLNILDERKVDCRGT